MSEPLRLIVVSGLSGSGKSVALHVLEDLGYYCIDNLPAALLTSLLDDLQNHEDSMVDRVAVGVDARNPQRDLQRLPELITELNDKGITTDTLFLHASDDVLLKRFSESRRRHPLSNDGTALRSAISRERALLSEITNAADLTIDTTKTSVYQLGELIRERVDRRKAHTLSVLVESFGFKHGIPADADFVFDVRCLPNPYWEPGLRAYTGLDDPVIEFLDSSELVQTMYHDILSFLSRWIPRYKSFDRGYLTVAVGCTGGQHRSVYMTEKLTKALRETHEPVLARHNELRAPS